MTWRRFLPRRDSAVGRSILAGAAFVERADVSEVALRRLLRTQTQPRVLMTCVYRTRNSERVQELIASLPPSAEVVLWALDEVHPALAAQTLSSGPGPRLTLHERMRQSAQTRQSAQAAPSDQAPPSRTPPAYWVISDDDVHLRPGALGDLVKLAELGDLDVSAPSHSYTSRYSHLYTMKRPLSYARETHFVEVGPVVVLSPKAQEVLLPFPTTTDAGWGFEAYWSSARLPDLRCALVDGIPVAHLYPMGTSYDSGAEYRRGLEFARTLGIDDIHGLKRTVSTWRPGRSAPPWTAAVRR